MFGFKGKSPKSLTFSALVIGALIGASALSVWAQTSGTWTAPTATPPGNNIAAPINVSTAPQAKSGLLGLSNFLFNPAWTSGSVATGSILTALDSDGTVGWGAGGPGIISSSSSSLPSCSNGQILQMISGSWQCANPSSGGDSLIGVDISGNLGWGENGKITVIKTQEYNSIDPDMYNPSGVVSSHTVPADARYAMISFAGYYFTNHSNDIATEEVYVDLVNRTSSGFYAAEPEIYGDGKYNTSWQNSPLKDEKSIGSSAARGTVILTTDNYLVLTYVGGRAIFKYYK